MNTTTWSLITVGEILKEFQTFDNKENKIIVLKNEFDEEICVTVRRFKDDVIIRSQFCRLGRDVIRLKLHLNSTVEELIELVINNQLDDRFDVELENKEGWLLEATKWIKVKLRENRKCKAIC